MSLNSIQLSPTSIQELYGHSLVELKSPAMATEPRPVAAINVLGKNQQHIVIVVNNDEVAFVPDEELNFLLGVLSACKLNMDDVGILNISKKPCPGYKEIAAELQAEKLILFGTTPDAIKLPLSFPHYQVQRYNDQTYLSAPALRVIQQDKAEKTKLWNSLKQLFSI